MNQKRYVSNPQFQQEQIHKLRGDISILLTVIILSGILTVGLAVSSWVVTGLRLARNITFSSSAYYAAESGMEQLLYDVVVNEATPPVGEYNSVTLDNGASFTVNVTSTDFFRARSRGTYLKANRQVEIQWPGKTW